MNIGFDTIGNATIIAYDRVPIIVTDPWIIGSAYFGSWRMSHEVPPEQMQAIRAARYVWFSHGHPDHLNADSLELLRAQKVLVPDHVGGRIRDDLRREGFDVTVLENKKWIQLSEHIRVMCISDYFQDAILLLDINGRLIINTNDAIDRGWGRFVRGIARDYQVTFLLALFGHGDADMINFYDEGGAFIEPRAARKLPVGTTIAQATKSWGTRYCIPFSSMHRYQRDDSVWANQYVTDLSDYKIGYESDTCELLPAFVRFDCENDSVIEINPAAQPAVSISPSEFGDNWTETLSEKDIEAATAYFRAITHLSTFLDFINLRVGGKDNVIELANKKFNRGVTFECPRHSLMIAISYHVFDDLLIGNFMKTTLQGNWTKAGLYPDFTPYVARYADNAKVRTKDELERYFAEYRKRAPLEYLYRTIEEKSVNFFRGYISKDSRLYDVSKRIYWQLKKIG